MESIYEILEPTDKAKTSMDILIDAQMNVRGYLTTPLKQETVLQELLFWYKITEHQLFQFRYIKVKRLYMFLLYEVCFWDYEKIAEITKCRTELEVIHGIDKIKAVMRKDGVLLASAGGIVEKAISPKRQ